MSDYRKHLTTVEVFRAIRESHPELIVFGSYSAPGGDRFGDPSKAVMLTSYGFEGDEFPVIEARTTWNARPSGWERENEKHEYWLCVGESEE